MVGWSLRFGIFIPALYYVGRRFFYFSFPWELPRHSLTRQCVAAGSCALLAWIILALRRGRHAESSRLDKRGHRGGLASSPVLRWIGTVALLSGAGACLFSAHYHHPPVYYDETFSPGDGETWIAQAHSPYLMASEPLGRWSHYAAYRLLGWLGHPDNHLAVRLSSVLAGVAYLAGLIILVPKAFPDLHRAAACLFLFLMPVALLYTGYPESTPWAYTLSGVYLLCGLRYITQGLCRPPWLESVFVMFAVATHGMVCFLTGAHALLIGCWLFRQRQAGPRQTGGPRLAILVALQCLLPFALLGILVFYSRYFASPNPHSAWFGNLLGGGDHSRWVRFFTRDYLHEYVFLGRRHLVDLFNLVLMACPLLFLVPKAIKDLWPAKIWEVAFLGAGLAGLLIFVLFWNADWGIRRDFDLFAMFALPAQMIIALWWGRRLEPRYQLPLALAVAFTTFVFALLPYSKLSWFL